MADIEAGRDRPRRPEAGMGKMRVRFWSADWSPWRALADRSVLAGAALRSPSQLRPAVTDAADGATETVRATPDLSGWEDPPRAPRPAPRHRTRAVGRRVRRPARLAARDGAREKARPGAAADRRLGGTIRRRAGGGARRGKKRPARAPGRLEGDGGDFGGLIRRTQRSSCCFELRCS